MRLIRVVVSGSLDVNLYRSGPRSLTCNSNLTLLGGLNVTGSGRFTSALQTASLTTGTVSATTVAAASIAAAGSVTGSSITASGIVSGAAIKHSYYFVARSTSGARPIPSDNYNLVDLLWSTVLRSDQISIVFASGIVNLPIPGLYMVTVNVILDAPALPDDNMVMYIYSVEEDAPYCTTKVIGQYSVLSCLYNAKFVNSRFTIRVFQQYPNGCYSYTTDGAVSNPTCLSGTAAYTKNVLSSISTAAGTRQMELAVALVTAY